MGALLAFSILLSLGSLGSMSYPAGILSQFLTSGCLILWVFHAFLNRARRGSMPVLFPWFMGFLAWLVLQALAQKFLFPYFGIPSGAWAIRLNHFSIFVAGFSLYLTTQEFCANRRRALLFTQFLVIASTALALYYVILFFMTPKMADNYPGPFPGLDLLKPWIGIYLQTNHFVDLFLPGIFYAASLVFFWNSREPHEEHPQKMIAFIFLNLCFACVLAAALLFTRSRGGILAFLAALFFYFVFFTLAHHHRHVAIKRLVIFLLVAGVFLVSLGMKEIFEELRTISQTFLEETHLQGGRVLTMGASWQVIKKQGILGVGLGNFHMGWLLHHKPPFDLFPERSYNDFLWMWAELGIFGMVLFWGMLVFFFFRSLRTALFSQSYFISYLLLASAAPVLAFALHSFLNPTIYIPPLFWLMSISLGMGEGVLRIEAHQKVDGMEKPLVMEKTMKGVSVCLVLALALVMAGISLNKVRAFWITQRSQDIEKWIQAARLDPYYSNYPATLATRYEQKYRKTREPENLEKALDAIDRAIHLAPFQLVYYMRRAQFLLRAGDESGVRETFERMRRRLPRFYLGEIVASAFYMTAAMDSGDAAQASRLEGAAIRHYLAARDLYPEFEKTNTLYLFASQKAVQRFEELSRAEQI